MEDIFTRINCELKYWESTGLLVFLGDDLGEAFLMEDSELYEYIIGQYHERSKLKSFLLCGKSFHMLLYYGEDGLQCGVNYFWDITKKLKNLVANSENDDTFQLLEEKTSNITKEKQHEKDSREERSEWVQD